MKKKCRVFPHRSSGSPKSATSAQTRGGRVDEGKTLPGLTFEPSSFCPDEKITRQRSYIFTNDRGNGKLAAWVLLDLFAALFS